MKKIIYYTLFGVSLLSIILTFLAILYFVVQGFFFSEQINEEVFSSQMGSILAFFILIVTPFTASTALMYESK